MFVKGLIEFYVLRRLLLYKRTNHLIQPIREHQFSSCLMRDLNRNLLKEKSSYQIKTITIVTQNSPEAKIDRLDLDWAEFSN